MMISAEALPVSFVLSDFSKWMIFFSQLTRLVMKESGGSLTLSERIAKYGKIRVLFVCDENLGRSPFFAAAMKRRVAETGLDDFVEIVSAGTKVDERRSKLKYDNQMHPLVRREIAEGIGKDFSGNSPTQYHSSLINENTILVILNDGKKILKKDRRKCLSVFNCGMEDPYDVGSQDNLGSRLANLEELLFGFTFDLINYLLRAVEQNSITPIPHYRKIDLQTSYCALF